MSDDRRTIDVIEICAGAGGQSLGLEKSGLSHAACVEIDAAACETLRHNRPRWKVIEGDATDPAVLDPREFDGIDILAGGVPCPPFSIAGKQLGASDERDLFTFAIGLLGQIRASALLLENVKGLAHRRFAGYRSHVLDQLAEWGYWADWRLLHASDFGVPQLRPRYILVALKEEYAPYFDWPAPIGSPPTVGETLEGLMGSNGWEHASDWARGAGLIAPTIVGGSKKHGGADLGPTRAKAAWRTLGVDGLGIADAPPPEGAPKRHMPRLTNPMVARLQGWTEADSWDFQGRKTAVYRQIGNAFPPPVAEAVGNAIRSALRKEGTPREDLTPVAAIDADVYRVLAEVGERFVSEERISSLTGRSLGWIHQSIEHLQDDFVIDTRKRRGLSEYRLVEFKGLASGAVETELAAG